jgi:hypothetical protein
VPYAKKHVVGAPFGTTAPVSVAEFVVTLVAGPVATAGAGQYWGVFGAQVPAADASEVTEVRAIPTATNANTPPRDSHPLGRI